MGGGCGAGSRQANKLMVIDEVLLQFPLLLYIDTTNIRMELLLKFLFILILNSYLPITYIVVFLVSILFPATNELRKNKLKTYHYSTIHISYTVYSQFHFISLGLVKVSFRLDQANCCILLRENTTRISHFTMKDTRKCKVHQLLFFQKLVIDRFFVHVFCLEVGDTAFFFPAQHRQKHGVIFCFTDR